MNTFTRSSRGEDLDVEKLIVDICNLNGNYISWINFLNYDLHGFATYLNSSEHNVCGPERHEIVLKEVSFFSYITQWLLHYASI